MKKCEACGRPRFEKSEWREARIGLHPLVRRKLCVDCGHSYDAYDLVTCPCTDCGAKRLHLFNEIRLQYNTNPARMSPVFRKMCEKILGAGD